MINFFRKSSKNNNDNISLLFKGKRNISEWLLKIEMIKQNENLEKNLDFSLINRMIVWRVVGESITKLLEILQYHILN